MAPLAECRARACPIAIGNTAREQGIQRNGFYHDRVPEFTITVRAKPGASRPRIGGAHGDPPELIVAVRETAASGRANAAIETAIATKFGIPPSMVDIRAGHAGRQKTVALYVPDGAAAQAILDRLLASGDD